MAILRSIDTKIAEGVLNLFKLDADSYGAAGYWRDRIRIGPWVGNDTLLITPQVSILAAPNAIFEPGVSGVADNTVALIIGCFERYQSEPFVPGATSSICKVRHLQKLIAQGSYDTVSSAFTNNGKIIDPDNPTSVDATQKYLNNSPATFHDLPPQVVVDKGGKAPVALLFPFIAAFVTREDNRTRIRA